MDYETLNKKPASDFLNPEKFLTAYDFLAVNAKLPIEQYEKGLRVGKQSKIIHISAFGTWGADLKSGAYLCSYEGIGYHAGTAALLRGFIDSGCAIVVHRLYGPDAKRSVLIK